jgi:hypothetical protein
MKKVGLVDFATAFLLLVMTGLPCVAVLFFINITRAD